MKRLQSSYRTHTCQELRKEHVGTEVTLSGWLMRKRDHGGVVFVDLRDHYGITQVIFHDEDKERIQNVRLESVLKVHGKVIAREDGLINPKLETGEIEVYCDSLEVLSESEILPFQIAEDDNAPETTR
ncbi:MAG: aspartate--tRNA ligase, partial [Bdellovibrionales bacterium]|nr:aspartate--tRNA ligase [Bdellovibrionales bacterium]